MPITFNCACVKALRIPDEHAGKRVRCTACGTVLTAPQTEEFDDFEVVEEPAAPAPRPAAPSKVRLKAVVAEEDAPAAPAVDSEAKPKKKKKKKKKAGDEETDDDWYENLRASEARMKRIFRGSAFIVLGAAIVIGVAVMWFGFRKDVTWLQESGGKSVIGLILLAVIGLAAIGKGVIGLAFGQFLGEDD